jgi:hypothetical protein
MAISPELRKPDLAGAIPVLPIRARPQRAPGARRDRTGATRRRPAFAPMREHPRLEIDREEPTWEDAEWQ